MSWFFLLGRLDRLCPESCRRSSRNRLVFLGLADLFVASSLTLGHRFLLFEIIDALPSSGGENASYISI